ncbi:MAG: hypothetical protein QXJ19_00625 [Candidatus Bathyarchaeia archaeon]|nr:hypothetical protein [Candidatus Bathyarchaeota archaeon]
MSNESELVGKFLYCSNLLEEKAAKAYEHIAHLVDDKIIKGLLGYIARDSFKHAECFRLMAELLSPKISISPKDCVEVWGESWLTAVKDAESFIEKKERVSRTDLKFLISGLERFESFVAEEYLTIIHAKLVNILIDEKGLNLGILKTVLEWIIEDEDRHKRILEIINSLLP